MTTLVTGGTGFMGTYLVQTLVGRGERVRAVDLRESLKPVDGVEYLIGDMRDAAFCRKICDGVSNIYNLAAMPSIAHGKEEEYFRANVGGLDNLLKAALDNGAMKVLHMSSSTVYGVPDICPIPENAPLKPIGAYSRSKLTAEQKCQEYRDKGMIVNIIRPRVIMGPGRVGIFSILFDRIMNNAFVPLIGSGKNRFQFTPVDALSEACIRVMDNLQNEVVNIGCRRVDPVREELSKLISRVGSKSKIVSFPASFARAGLKVALAFGISPLVNDQFRIADKDFVLDTTKAEKLLGWNPQESNLDTLMSAYAWYKDHAASIGKQYSGFAGILGKFKNAKMGAYQK